jgi:hypothetical protein
MTMCDVDVLGLRNYVPHKSLPIAPFIAEILGPSSYISNLFLAGFHCEDFRYEGILLMFKIELLAFKKRKTEPVAKHDTDINVDDIRHVHCGKRFGFIDLTADHLPEDAMSMH